jgi:SAM-dependent methyltransferase
MVVYQTPSEYREYGMSGVGQRAIIDNYLNSLSDSAAVPYLGCGPNEHNYLLNLARKLVSLSTLGCKTLTAVDIEKEIVESVKHQKSGWPPNCGRITRIRCLDAEDMTSEIEDESYDLAIALGLFGGLLVETDQRPSAFARILRESIRVLKRDGLLLVGNSFKRQPAEQFIDICRETGFSVIECSPPSRTMDVGNRKHPDMRYLLVLRKS